MKRFRKKKYYEVLVGYDHGAGTSGLVRIKCDTKEEAEKIVKDKSYLEHEEVKRWLDNDFVGKYELEFGVCINDVEYTHWF